MNQCPPNRFAMEYCGKSRARWLAKIPPGHTSDDVRSPDYFGQIRNVEKLTVGDVIEVVSDDLKWWGEMFIRALPTSIPQVYTLVRYIQQIDEAKLPGGFDIEFRGGASKHVLVRDGFDIEGGFNSEEEAALRAEFLSGVVNQTRRPTRKTQAA